MQKDNKNLQKEEDGIFMPSLFNRNEEVQASINSKQVIPQNTYYDMGVAVQHHVESRHVCVFGISSATRGRS